MKKINWALVGAVVVFLAGAAGTTLVPVIGQHVANDIRAILLVISGVLTVVSGGGAVTLHVSRARAAAFLAADKERMDYAHKLNQVEMESVYQREDVLDERAALHNQPQPAPGGGK